MQYYYANDTRNLFRHLASCAYASGRLRAGATPGRAGDGAAAGGGETGEAPAHTCCAGSQADGSNQTE